MRQPINFDCQDDRLAATIDHADGRVGLFIVSGGNEIRCGAHRGIAALAAHIAAAGHPVLRFDRRGIGDSAGQNTGFLNSRDDLAAALDAFRNACPAVQRIVAFGNCDAASALLLHQPLAIDALVLANPWTIEGQDENDGTPALPPTAAIKARYWARLRDPASLRRLLRGEVDMGKLARGLTHLSRRTATPPADSLGQRVIGAIAVAAQPVTLLLTDGDRTAQAFAEHWHSAPAALRARIALVILQSNSHSFSGDDADWLMVQLLTALNQRA